MSSFHCVICCSSIEVSCGSDQNKESEIKFKSRTLQSGNRLKSQLDVVFVLREIFRVQSVQLETYLKKWGDPGDWVKLCERCVEDVCNIRKIFVRLHEIKRELEKAKCVIQERVRVSKEEERVMPKMTGIERIFHECRRNFCTQWENQKESNVCTLQDQRAKEFAARIETENQNIVKEELAENEYQTLEEENDTFDLDPWESEEFQLQSSPRSSNSNQASEENIVKIKGETCSPIRGDEYGSSTIPMKTVSGRKRRNLKRINYNDNNERDDDDSDIETKRTKFVRTEPAILELPETSRKIPSCLSSDECSSTSVQESYSGRKRQSLKRLKNDHGNNKKKRRTKLAFPKLKAPGSSTPTKSPHPREVRCPVCRAHFSLGPFRPFSEHFQACVATLTKPTSLKCLRCKSWSGPSKNFREFLEHFVLCLVGHNSKPVPWRHALIRCNLCSDSCYVPYTEFTSHVHNRHQHRYGCSQCSYRCQKSGDISRKHWNRHHSDLPNVPSSSRYERLPDGTKMPLPYIPWWCPASECFQEFSDEASRDQHVTECQDFFGQLPERSAKCSFCNSDYFFEEELLMHRTSVHGYLFQANAHKCEECNAILETSRQLLTHRRRQHGLNPIRCETCGAEFSVSEALWSHVRLKHGSAEKLKEFTCKICQKVFGQKCLVRRHIKRAHNVECEECGEKFEDEKSLISHMSSEHQHVFGTDFTCKRKDCHQKFSSYSLLRNHIGRCHINSAFHCSFCGKTFRRHSSLRKHTAMKSCRLPTFRCYQCKLSFTTNDMLTEHRRQFHIHSKRIRRKPKKATRNSTGTNALKTKFDLTKVTISEDNSSVTCNICGKKFESLDKARMHVRSVHEKVLCSECGVSLRQKSDLTIHMITVHGVGEGHKCEVCGKIYASQLGLQKHKQGHSQEESAGISDPNKKAPCICDTCGKTYSDPSNLRKHIKHFHENYLPKKCDLCDIAFPEKVCLLRHKANVHGEGDYKCEAEGCSKVFWQKKDFENHKMYKHEGLSKPKLPKRYTCQFCGKAFADKIKATVHEKALHTNKDSKPFKCTVLSCEKTFAVLDYLKYHLKYTHKMENDVIKMQIEARTE